MKNIIFNTKIMVMLVCMTLGFAIVAKGQISNKSVMFFTDSNNVSVSVVRCVDNKMYCQTYSRTSVENDLRRSPNYFDDYTGCGYTRDATWWFDKSMSTSKYTVYQHNCTFGTERTQTRPFVAISKDLSEMIQFSRYDDNKEVYNKHYYIRITKEDLLPKSVGSDIPDFLND